MEIDENKGVTRGAGDGGDEQVENTLGALIRIASRLESTPAMGEKDDVRQGRRRRLAEFGAMAAVVLAASAVGVALWGQTPAKASPGPSTVKSAPKAPTCTG